MAYQRNVPLLPVQWPNINPSDHTNFLFGKKNHNKWSWLQFKPGKTSLGKIPSVCWCLWALDFSHSLIYSFQPLFIQRRPSESQALFFQENTDHTHSCTHLQPKSAHHNHSLICSPQHLRVKYPVGRLPSFIAGTHTDKQSNFLSCQWTNNSLPVYLICAVQWLAPRTE